MHVSPLVRGKLNREALGLHIFWFRVKLECALKQPLQPLRIGQPDHHQELRDFAHHYLPRNRRVKTTLFRRGLTQS